jgi:hypothetical protein
MNVINLENNVLRYKSTTSPAGLFDINPYTGEISFTPLSPGFYNANITVSDGTFNVSTIIQYNISKSMQKPKIEFIPQQAVLVGTPLVYQIKAMDLDNNTLYYTANTSFFNISSSGLINFTPSMSQLGIYNILVNVSNGVLSDSRILFLTVYDINRAPRIVSAPQNTVVNRNSLLRLNISACDPDIMPGCI